MTDSVERVEPTELLKLIREVSAQSQASAEILQDALLQLEDNTKALNEATAVIKETRRELLATKKKSRRWRTG